MIDDRRGSGGGLLLQHLPLVDLGAVHADAGGELGEQDLHHHLPAQRRLVRHEHARHAAAAELALDGVVIAERAL